MHELALVQELCALATAAAQRHGATRIERLQLRLGDRCGVDADAVVLDNCLLNTTDAADELRSG